MIVQNQITSVISGGDYQEFFFNLNQEGLSIVLDILRNQLYSNKELAIIRELCSNAYDAMVENGKKDQPFDVTLPTQDDSVFKVRDYGKGLTPQEVLEVFVSYGASTKRGSNDFIGQKGIGAKSPFAYGDSFLVISYQRGRKITYSAYLDTTMIGKMAVLSDEETTEADGLEVVVNVREADINKFVSEAQKFFQYWLVRPNFFGTPLVFQQEKIAFQGKDKGWFIPERGTNGYYSAPMLIMGGIPYILDSGSLDWSGRDQSVSALFNIGIKIFVEIGQVEVSASREALQYTSLTQRTIFDKLAGIIDELFLEINDKLANNSTMYQAKLMHRAFFDLASPLYVLRQLFGGKITYQGQQVTSNYWDDQKLPMGASVWYYIRATGRRRRAFHEEARCKIKADLNRPIIIRDTDSDYGILSRIAPLLEREENFLGRRVDVVQVIRITDVKTWEAWVQGNYFDAPIINLSSLPKANLKEIYPVEGRVNNCYYNSKHFISTFLFDKTSCSYRDRTSFWAEYDIDYDVEEGVFVEIDKFSYLSPEGYTEHPSCLRDLIESLGKAGIEVPEIIGIKSGRLKKGAPKNMISFWAFIKNELEKRKENPVLCQYVVDQQEANKIHSQQISNYTLQRLEEIKSPSLATFIEDYRFLVNQEKKGQFDVLIMLFSKFGIKPSTEGLSVSRNISGQIQRLRDKYPLLFIMISSVDSLVWGRSLCHLDKYVALIDKEA